MTEAVKRALGAIRLPDGQNLLASGRLSDIVADGGTVSFSIAITPPEAQAFEAVRKAAEQASLSVPGVSKVHAILTADRPAPKPAAQPQGQRTNLLPQVKHIVAVASGKGGVGKSTSAANIALGLVAQGLKVGLLDADIFGPSVPTLFGLSGKPQTVDGKTLVPMEAYGLKLMSIGVLVDEGTAMIWRGPMVMSAVTQLLRDVAWGALDVLVIDMPPGTGDVQLSMVQAVPLAGAIIISTPQDLALIDARRGVAMFGKTDVPILGLVENMASFCCPNCNHVTHIFGHGGARVEAEKLGVPFLGEVPLDLEVRQLSDAGRPITAVKPESVHATIYKDIAAQVWTALNGGMPRKAPPRIILE